MCFYCCWYIHFMPFRVKYFVYSICSFVNFPPSALTIVLSVCCTAFSAQRGGVALSKRLPTPWAQLGLALTIVFRAAPVKKKKRTNLYITHLLHSHVICVDM